MGNTLEKTLKEFKEKKDEFFIGFDVNFSEGKWSFEHKKTLNTLLTPESSF